MHTAVGPPSPAPLEEQLAAPVSVGGPSDGGDVRPLSELLNQPKR